LPQNTTSTTGTALAIVFGLLLAIALIVVGVFVMRHIRHTRKLHGAYNPAREELANNGTAPMPLTALGAKDERLI
jgi:uncharacterized membrane protein YciS (DUF1049 family)